MVARYFSSSGNRHKFEIVLFPYSMACFAHITESIHGLRLIMTAKIPLVLGAGPEPKKVDAAISQVKEITAILGFPGFQRYLKYH